VAAFGRDPNNTNNFYQLAFDTIKLVSVATVVSNQVTQLGGYLKEAESAGIVTGLQATGLDFTLSGAQASADQLLGAAVTALGDLTAALVAFGSGHGNLQPLQTPTGQTQTNGTVTESITNAPATASESGGVISQSVTVNNPSNAPVTVKVTYSATDGTGVSTSDTCTNGTITLPCGAPPSAPGVVGTWTTSVAGLPTQTNTTTWTQ
jgi:hypothetical protein